MVFHVQEEIAYYDPQLRMSWREGGAWPQSNRCHFNEAVVSSSFVLRGYTVLREFSATRPDLELRPLAAHSTALLHEIVGDEVSSYFCNDLEAATDGGSGEPGLFVFREEHHDDPKFPYRDGADWFFVEVNGPGDEVSEQQKHFWHLIAERLGADRIRLFRTAPLGEPVEPACIEY